MVIHKLIARHLKHQDDAGFYILQAEDALRWMERHGVDLSKKPTVLDLGCGHGIFGQEFQKRGCPVSYADYQNLLSSELRDRPFVQVDLNRDDYARLGRHDLVVCSNVLEHLAKPRRFLTDAPGLIKPGGHLYLSWTNWLSPWGGHDFSPWHYLGPRRGVAWWSKLKKRRSDHTMFENLFPTYIGEVLGWIRQIPELEIVRVVPRYYPEFAFLMKLPGIREFLSWNCAILLRRRSPD